VARLALGAAVAGRGAVIRRPAELTVHLPRKSLMSMKFFTAIALLFASFTATAAEKIEIKSAQDIRKCEDSYRWDAADCFAAYEKFVDKNPGKAFEAAKVGGRVFARWSMLPTFDKVYQRTKNIAVCQDEDFQLSLMNALWGLPSFHDVRKMAEKYLKNACAPHLVNAVIKELDDTPETTATENFCALLKSQGKNHSACEPKPVTVAPEPEKETLPQIAKSSLKLEQIKAYRGPEGIKVFIAEIREQKDVYLVKFQGIKGPWNNRTILHKARRMDRNGNMDYWTEHDGAIWNSVLVRHCSGGYCQRQIYAPEQGYSDGISISYDEKESEKASAQDLVATF
jgi:hypothetical protein